MTDTFLITGANRGIGLELVRTLLGTGHRVIATCRDPRAATALAAAGDGDTLEILPLEVTDPDSVARLADALDGRAIDVLVNNAGVMHRDESADAVDYDAWLETLAVNTIAPFRLATTLQPNLLAANRPRVVTISSQMGSIERGGTGSVAYRSSKAAVNRAMRTLADEWAESGITVIVVHPGWVRTDMGGAEAALSSSESAAGIVRVVDGLTPADTGRFLNHDGTTMPW